VAGWSTAANGGQHAFLFGGGKMTDLGLLPGEGGIYTAASGINNSNQVVGTGDNSASDARAFLDSGGRMIDLGAYNIDTVAEAINASGVIVGQTYGVDKTGSPFTHAFICTGGRFQDLNGLIPAGSGFVLDNATSINANGQIIANGISTTNGQGHAFLLNPS
jgi:probable HAF family extracellular repeat protein